MAVCGLRTILLIVCILQLIITVQRQVFDFLGYMWLPIIANFINILLIIFGSFGAVQYVTKYLIAYAIWSFIWITWNIFLICYYLNLGSLNRDSGLLSLGTGSVSWWEGNGWGCQPVWSEVDGPGSWRPTRVDGCFLQWDHVELAQSTFAALFATMALPLAILLTFKSLKKHKPVSVSDKSTISRSPAYTIELSQTEPNISESSLKPMTPRRVKRRSGSRGTGSSVRRSRRSYRNAGYLASSASLPRDPRASRPTSAHSSYSNFHGARPASYHPGEAVPNPPFPNNDYGYSRAATPERMADSPPVSESVPIRTNKYNTIGRTSTKSGYDVVGPYNEPNPPRKYEPNIPDYDNIERGYDVNSYGNAESIACESAPYGYGGAYGEAAWPAPPPPAPPYSARATPQAPGPPAYQPVNDIYNMSP